MAKFELPLAGNLPMTSTGIRLPGLLPAQTGLYMDVTPTSEPMMPDRRVYRIEARIGAQFAVASNVPPHVIDRVRQDVSGAILRHAYGPFLPEIINARDAMRFVGVYPENPAFERLTEIADALASAFRGDF